MNFVVKILESNLTYCNNFDKYKSDLFFGGTFEGLKVPQTNTTTAFNPSKNLLFLP